jgi:CheY-like chemotaxis protein
MKTAKQVVRKLQNTEVSVRDGVFFMSRGGSRPPGGEVPAIQKAANGTLKRALKPRHVLVVEDNLDSVHSLVFLLRDMGHHVDYAINGYAALDLARRTHPEFILLDLGLPGMDGWQMCRSIKADPKLTPIRVIAITRYADGASREKSMAAGCEAHLVKPVAPADLEKILA